MTENDAIADATRRCRICGCTDMDCSQCIRRTGEPCWWVAADLCSACAPRDLAVATKAAAGPVRAVPATPAGSVSSAVVFLRPVTDPCYWPNCRCVREGVCLQEGQEA